MQRSPYPSAMIVAIGLAATCFSTVTLQAAAEAEVRLAQAERAKAVVPLCVGVSATASAFALLAPALLYGATYLRKQWLTLRAIDPAPFAVRLISGFFASVKFSEDEFYAADGAPSAA